MSLIIRKKNNIWYGEMVTLEFDLENNSVKVVEV
jgi:hypothetical protein